MRVGLLTGGHDKHYAAGLASALAARGMLVDFVGSDNLRCPEVTDTSGITFLNLRGDQRQTAPVHRKVLRLFRYYVRLMVYAAVSESRILHILWNNKLELFDRTALMLFYRLAGKRVLLTAHNVNAAKRDRHDSLINRLSLCMQYRLCDHIFVHTERMKAECIRDFRIRQDKVTVIPYGINNMVPMTRLGRTEARQRIGVADDDKVVLFFGMIAPYKGLEHLVRAVAILARAGIRVRLMIAGQVKKGCTGYWDEVKRAMADGGIADAVIERIDFVPDDDLEVYFKATDVVAIPYTAIFQSGILFLAFNFGVPVIATDVGSFKDDVLEGRTGLLCAPNSPESLADAIRRFFASALYEQRDSRREEIRRVALERHSWATVAEITQGAYMDVLSKAAEQHGRQLHRVS